MLKPIGKLLQRLVFPPLSWIEQVMLGRQQPGSVPLNLLAIVGPPRMGSTLLYALLAQSTPAFYISNFEYVGYRAPLFFSILRSRMLKSYKDTEFRSDYGYIDRPTAPAEANLFWEYWFDYSFCEKRPSPVASRKRHVRRCLEKICASHAHTILTAWTAHAYYIPQNNEFFDGTFFVCVERDPVDTAISIYKGRQKRGDTEKWFSLRPLECANTEGMSVYEQIAAQVHYTYRRVKQQARAFPGRVCFLPYHELCSVPRESLTYIAECASTAGIRLQLDIPPHIPHRFPFVSYQTSAQYTEQLRLFREALERVENV